jgi:hypothetical protein
MSVVNHIKGTSVFNARDLKIRELASKFVAPAAFQTLLGDFNCVLEGPRGSGKTTLLRMLTPEAFALWSGSQESACINFIGIFVPADVRWAKQLDARLVGLEDVPRQLFMESSFAAASALAFVETLECCAQNSSRYGESFPELFFKVSRDEEATLVRQLSSLWSIPVEVPSFVGLKFGLRLRQQLIGHLSVMVAAGSAFNEIARESAFLSQPWLDSLASAVELTNSVLGRPEQRWAVLLDELEIVPKEILECVVRALRSTTPLVKFKLALSPTGTDLMFSGDNTAPTPDNDYRSIPLWYDTRKDARAFSERLFQSAMSGHGIGGQEDIVKALGPNWMGGSYDEDGSVVETMPDAAKKLRIQSFVSLYEKDESFKYVLDSRGIDPGDPPLSDESSSGTFVRKITPLVCLRDREIASFSSADGVKKKGGRRGADAYSGYPNLLDLAEGNPRWVLTLADLLHTHARVSGQSIRASSVQSSVVNDFTESFVAKLTVYPTGRSADSKRWTLMKFVDALGNALAQSLYDREFTSDPALSFRLDAKGLNQYEDYIRLCIDLGALVLMRAGTAPLGEAAGCSSLEGARVRVSYRLAPLYRLPLRSIKERSISGALQAGTLFSEGSPTDPLSKEGPPLVVQQQRLL